MTRKCTWDVGCDFLDYGGFTTDFAKAATVSVGSSVVSFGIGLLIAAFVPGPGWVAGGAMILAGTAIGYGSNQVKKTMGRILK